jgi:methanogenic corrinoid protein MtbC1
LIRQKVIVGIEQIKSVFSSGKSILLFLPENEHHELGLLFLHFLLKSRGLTVIYLGANVPISDLEYTLNIKKPDFVYTHLTTVVKEFNFERFLNNLKLKAAGTPVYISGGVVSTYEHKAPGGDIRFLKTFKEVQDFIAQIAS